EWKKMEERADGLKKDIEREERIDLLDGATRVKVDGQRAHLLDPSIGMTKDEVRSYSLVRAINAAATNS
ncbi:MAG: hypothetical protein GTO08_03070, partial [Deltaproteobacteria bacterium]|nr:hypothetical protein [Deltaproteobacteria bacterium]